MLGKLSSEQPQWDAAVRAGGDAVQPDSLGSLELPSFVVTLQPEVVLRFLCRVVSRGPRCAVGTIQVLRVKKFKT